LQFDIADPEDASPFLSMQKLKMDKSHTMVVAGESGRSTLPWRAFQVTGQQTKSIEILHGTSRH